MRTHLASDPAGFADPRERYPGPKSCIERTLRVKYGGEGGTRKAGRGGGIRTPDPLLPKQMRYQTALRPDLHDSIAFRDTAHRLLLRPPAARYK